MERSPINDLELCALLETNLTDKINDKEVILRELNSLIITKVMKPNNRLNIPAKLRCFLSFCGAVKKNLPKSFALGRWI